MEIKEFQSIIWRMYRHHDEKRGLENTFKWLRTEVEELWDAITKGDEESIREEMADVFAWLSSVANLLEVDLEKASIERYGRGCPKCGYIPCRCSYREKPCGFRRP